VKLDPRRSAIRRNARPNLARQGGSLRLEVFERSSPRARRQRRRRRALDAVSGSRPIACLVVVVVVRPAAVRSAPGQ
jgi:hypothetical protein